MPRNKYYYYDHESCTFVEVKRKGATLYRQAAAITAVSAILAVMMVWMVDKALTSPEEMALRAENEALQSELQRVGERIEEYASRVDELSESDQKLYRTLLEADPISKDVRRVGVGGADPYESFARYSSGTSSMLQQSGQMLDELERKINLQNASYRQLTRLASERDRRMEEMPAILPSDGPLVSGYGVRMHPILRVRRMHHGIDIVVPIGTPVFSTGDGVVKSAARDAGYGKHIEISHPSTGFTTLYAHLDEIPPHIRPGRKVKRGEQIGLSGNTGRSTGPHVHYEVRDQDGRTLNPVHFFAPSMTPQAYKELLEASERESASFD
ncbi:MAG: M23 family metallopeptidase [Rhodothermales bacterium]